MQDILFKYAKYYRSSRRGMGASRRMAAWLTSLLRLRRNLGFLAQGDKSRWKPIDGATNLKQGVAFVERNLPGMRLVRDAGMWEVGCKTPPKNIPQAHRGGFISS